MADPQEGSPSSSSSSSPLQTSVFYTYDGGKARVNVPSDANVELVRQRIFEALPPGMCTLVDAVEICDSKEGPGRDLWDSVGDLPSVPVGVQCFVRFPTTSAPPGVQKTNKDDEWKAEMSAQMAQVNARVARLSIGEQPSSAAKTYATSFKEYEARSKPIMQPEFDFTTNKSGWKRFQEMLQEFQDEKKKAEKTRFEAKFQELLLRTLNKIFTKLNFVDTSKRNDIAYPVKPDITVVENGHYANFSTVLGLIEVKDCSVGNEECGQLVNAVAIAYEKQHEKRPIWGFVIGPKDTTNFVCCCVESETFQMTKDVPYDELLSFLRNLALGSQVVLPSLPDYEVKCELGRGLTSRVFCVNNERGDWVLKLPKPNHNHATRIVANEATIMNEMGTNQAVRENPHLAKFVAKVSVTFQGHTQDGILLFPPATNKKVRLTQQDVTELAGALFDLHKAGYLHRDVSPGNIGHYLDRSSQCQPFLRDFGFAVTMTEKTENDDEVEGRIERKLPFAGTVVTASNRILVALSTGNTEVTVGRRDDLESLCKSAILLASGSRVGVDESSLAERANEVLSFWKSRGSVDEGALDDILQSNKYENIRRYFTSLPSRIPFPVHSKAHTPPPEKIQTPPSAQIPSPSAPLTPSFAQSPFALDRHQPHTQDSPEFHFPPKQIFPGLSFLTKPLTQ